jgi:hypothetical protein
MKQTFIIITAFALMGLGSCKKDLLDTAPYDQLGSANMWLTDNLTDLGVNGIYQALRLNYGNPDGYEPYQTDMWSFTGMHRNAQAMMQGTILPNNALFSNYWRGYYEGIIRANDAITNIPVKSPSADIKKARLIAEAKFLRGYFYFKLNEMWRGVPVYLEPVNYDEFNKPRETEQAVWEVVIKDLTDAINEPTLPNRYPKGNTNFGRATKSAAYALRGKTYLYMGRWNEAAADFAKVEEAGHALFPNYRELFREANEQSEEMIFSVQNISVPNLGSSTQFYVGTRSSFGSCWNNFLVSPNLVDLYENADGSAFTWDNVIPGYSATAPAARQVYFFRDNMTAGEISAANNRGADMSKYLPTGNEARIKKAYENRDPRLRHNVIVPYDIYNGVLAGAPSLTTSRFPYRTEGAPTRDLRTDTQNFFFYLYRKYVYEGLNELVNRAYGPIDYPIIRFADVLLMWAEARTELNDVSGALQLVNRVRARAGIPALQQTDASLPTFVSGQENMRQRIRNERRVEFPNEGINFYDEVRWKTWKQTTFKAGNGVQQIWGQNNSPYNWAGDFLYLWPIPQVEMERNPGLTQNPGWPN